MYLAGSIASALHVARGITPWFKICQSASQRGTIKAKPFFDAAETTDGIVMVLEELGVLGDIDANGDNEEDDEDGYEYDGKVQEYDPYCDDYDDSYDDFM